MSTIEVKIVKAEILPHNNAEKLELCRINGEGGYVCVVGKGQFVTGDLVIYVPPDSVISEEMNNILAARSKIDIKGGRIRPIKIRNVLSEGLCLTPEEWLNHPVQEGDDVTSELGITKYEPPPPPNKSILRSGSGVNFHYTNEHFKAYHCVEKFKKYPSILAELSPEVVATVKYHGTNFRCGLVTKPIFKKTFWQKLIGLFIKDSPQEFLVGSHDRIKIPSKNALKYGDYYGNDTWWRAAKKYDLEHVVREIANHEAMMKRVETIDVALYAEIIGPGIQKGYEYGIQPGEIDIRVFDIMVGGEYVDWDVLVHFCKCFGLPVVKEVYRGPWSLDVTKHAAAIDTYNGKQYVREGVVIRPVMEMWHPECKRVIFKYINEDYLLDKTNSEFH